MEQNGGQQPQMPPRGPYPNGVDPSLFGQQNPVQPYRPSGRSIPGSPYQPLNQLR